MSSDCWGASLRHGIVHVELLAIWRKSHVHRARYPTEAELVKESTLLKELPHLCWTDLVTMLAQPHSHAACIQPHRGNLACHCNELLRVPAKKCGR